MGKARELERDIRWVMNCLLTLDCKPPENADDLASQAAEVLESQQWLTDPSHAVWHVAKEFFPTVEQKTGYLMA